MLDLYIDAEKYSWGEFTNWGENYAGSSSDIHSPRPVEMMPHRERSATVRSNLFPFLRYNQSERHMNFFPVNVVK